MPYRIERLISFALLLLVSPAFAGDWQLSRPTGKISQSANAFTTRLRGMPNYQQRVDLEVEETFTNETFSLRATPWAWARLPDARGALERKPRIFFEMKEGWAEYASPNFDLRIGNQIFAWGAADTINPTDVWNPRDYHDPFQSTKLPITALRLSLHPEATEHVAFEFIFTPFFRESTLPIALPKTGARDFELGSSRWLLPLPSVLSTSGLTAPLFYKVNAATYSKSWQVGGKLKLMQLGGWDFSFTGYSGVETNPRIAITKEGSGANPALPVNLTLHPSFHRQTMLGFDGGGSVSVAGHDIGTRFEVAYLNHDNSRVRSMPTELQADLFRDNDLFGVAGFDYTFAHDILGTTLYLNLMYVHYQNLGATEQAPGRYTIQGLPTWQPFDDNVVAYWENRIDSKLKFSNAVIFSFKNNDGFVNPALHYDWTDNFKTQLGGELFVGSQSGFYGQFRDNRRVNFTASYAF